MAEKLNTIVIWDYDWSMIDQNCDTFVVQKLRPELAPLINECYGKMSWTSVMGILMQKMFEDGVSAQEILDIQADVPLLPKCL